MEARRSRRLGSLDPSSNQEKKQKNLDKAGQKLLKNHPPKQNY